MTPAQLDNEQRANRRDMSEPLISVVLESNKGGLPMTLCACGVLLMATMADSHTKDCLTYQRVLASEATPKKGI